MNMFRKFYSAGRIETRTLEDIETGTHVSVTNQGQDLQVWRTH